MTEMLQYIRQADQAFWGGSFYQIWFLAAVLLILFLEKSPVTKRIIGIYPICFILLLYNPLAYRIVQTYTTGGVAYFARLFSMIPLPITLGLGTVLLTERISSIRVRRIPDSEDLKENATGHSQIRTAVKMILFSCCCGAVLIFGPTVYKEVWFQPAQNYEKVPEDIIDICRVLHRDEGVTIAGPGLPSRYIRQVDASFYMPYGRHLNELGETLSQEDPDPEYVMIEAGKQGCDYIIVDNNEINIIDFYSFGWEPYYVQGNYQIYKVEGVPRTVHQYNSKRQLIMQTTYDEEDNPIRNERGYYGIRYKYDQAGNKIKETYLDRDHETPMILNGYSSIAYGYDPYTKRVISQVYLNEKDEPVSCNGRIETRYEYNGKGVITQERYYDEDGNLTDHSEKHYASRKISLDDKGRIRSEQYYDKDGKPARTSMGYSSYEVERNEKDEIIRENFYDAEGKLIARTGEGADKNSQLIRYHVPTDGVYEENTDGMVFSTMAPNNRFSMIGFQLISADKTQYLLSFGESSSVNEITGEYVHDLPDGVYCLRMKANTNLADEYADSLVYLKKGDRIAYRYVIDEFGPNRIRISGVSVCAE